MKVVLGAVTMSAFVSGRKLVSDAFAALEHSRVILLAAMVEPPIEPPVETESLVAEESALSSVKAETQTEEAIDPMGPLPPLAELVPIPLDNFTPDRAAETLPEDVFVASAPSDPIPMFLAETNIDEATNKASADEVTTNMLPG